MKMKHVKTFENFKVNEGSFEKIVPSMFEPFGLKKIAKSYFDLCKNDQKLIDLVKKYINERPSYTEGPDPRPASDNLRNYLESLFPYDENNEKLYKVHHVSNTWPSSGSYTITALSYLLDNLISYINTK